MSENPVLNSAPTATSQSYAHEVVREDEHHIWMRCVCGSHVGSAYPELIGQPHGYTHCCDASHDAPPGETRFAKPPTRLAALHRFVDAFDEYHDSIDREGGAGWQKLCAARVAVDKA